MASVNDKVNLQVQALALGSNVVQLQFRFISWENFPVALNNYRIVSYFNTYKNPAHIALLCQNSGHSVGHTTGSLTVDNGSINIDFFNTSPKIYPPTQRYDKEIIFPFTGSAAIVSAGSSFEQRINQLQINSTTDFIAENGNSGYVTGQAAFSTSYSYTTSNSYEDNNTFILEFNDPTHGWIKVQEYSNATTPDSNTGKYPYDVVYEAKKALGDINRLYGYDTGFDHQRLVVSIDTYIDQHLPTSSFNSATTFSLNGSANSDPSSRIGLFKFDSNALSQLIISGCEFYNYWGASIHTIDIGCYLNTADVTSASTWSTNASGIYGAQEMTMNTGSNQNFRDSYIGFKIDTAEVQNWVTTSSTNLGLNLRYTAFAVDERYNDPTVYLKGNGTYYDPVLFVYGGPTSATTVYKRWQGHTNSNWSVGSNWEGGVVPGTTDYATFDSSYSTCACTLDSNQSILNLSAVGGVYSGQIDLGSSTLSINDTSFSLGLYSNLITSASTLDFKNDAISAYLSNGFSFNSVIFENGATLVNYGSFSANNIQLYAGKTLNGFNQTTITILSGGTVQMGSSSVMNGSLRLTMLSNAQITDLNGTFNNTVIQYIGNSIIKSRVYDCPVEILLPVASGNIYNVTFTTGTCTFNNTVMINENGRFSTSYFNINMSANNPLFIFNNGFQCSYAMPRRFVNIIFPSGTTNFSGNLTLSDALSGTSNTSSSILNMIGNNTLTYSYTGYGSLIQLPRLYKDNGQLTLSADTNHISFNEIEIYNPASVKMNSNALFSTTSLSITGPNTLYTLAGSIISADTIRLIGGPSYMNATATSAWSAYATTSLNANLVNLQNSVASNARGYAIHSLDNGSNVNWFFDVVPPTITKVSATPSSYSKTPITVSYNAYDSGAILASDVGLVGSFGTIRNIVQVNSNNVSFDVVLSGSNKSGFITVSANDQALNYAQLIDGPYSYDNTPPVISVISVTPSTSSSSNYIDITVQAIDNCTFDESNSANIFNATWDSVSVSPISISEITSADFTATYRLTASDTLLNGNLYISASDAASNTGSFYSSALSINKGATSITFKSNPISKIGYAYINVSAIFEDILGMNTFIPYQMMYNGQNFPFDTIYQTSVKVLLSGTVPSSMGDGVLSVSGYNSVGILTTSSDSGYKFIPTIIFGDPVPSNISKTTITVPISAIGSFTTDVNNYYCKLSATRMPISQPTSSSIVVQGYTFDYLKFSATVSSVNDIRGELILSAGY